MLQPMRTKFRKAHKGRIKGAATSGATLSFGQFGLKAMERWVERALRNLDNVARDLLQTLRNGVSVDRAERNDFQDE